MNHKEKYRTDIDGLRAVAVLLVIVFHAFPNSLKGGFIGVDIFFVISGYLISTIIFDQLEDRSFSFRLFYVRRINRIFPALILVLVACYAFGWFALLNAEFIQLGKHLASGAGFVSNIVLWKESGYFDNSSELKPFLHLWSLAVEEQFYIIWPLMLYFSFKRGFNLLTIIIIFLIASFLFNVRSVYPDRVGTFYSITTRFWELLVGSYLAHITKYRKEILEKIQLGFESLAGKIIYGKSSSSSLSKLLVSNLKASVGIIMIFTAAYFFNKTNAFPGMRALLPTLGTLLLISAGPMAWFNNKVLSHRALVWIGLISYPLYLWHWPILSFLRIVEFGDETSILRRCLSIIVSILLAWLTYLFLEKPIRQSNKKLLITKTLVGIMLLVGLFGFQTYKNPPQRLGLQIRKFEIKSHLPQLIENRDKNCPLDMKSQNLSLSYCALSQVGKPPTIALIGDSHANSLYNGLSNFYKSIDKNLIFLGQTSTLPFFGSEVDQFGRTDIPHKNVNASLKYVLDNPNIKTIILASRGTIYITGKGFFEPNAEQFVFDSKDPENRYLRESFESAMTATLSQLVQSKKEIIFFIDVPELGFYPTTCLEPRIFSMAKKPKDPCGVSKEDFNKRNKIYITSVMSVLKKFPTVKIFDQSKYLCDEKFCYGIIDGKIMYLDGNHLSYDGSTFMSEKFRNYFYNSPR